ncbi:MAG: response regulator transcription factor [Dehalococcoidia bacterium]
MEAIRVLLADDHTLFRRGIATMLSQMPGIEVIGEAANGSDVVTLANELVPDVILMDIKMPEQSGIEATRAILKENPHIGIILVTMFDDPESVFDGMRAGTRGYVLKEAEPEELRRAVEAAHRGEVMLCPVIARRVLDHFAGESQQALRPLPYEQLSQRELQVLQLAADGLTNRDIAQRLVISEKTAKNHIANIFSKLNVNDRTQAVIQALRMGLVTMSPAEPRQGRD